MNQLSRAASDKLTEALKFVADEVAGKTDALAVLIEIRAGFDGRANVIAAHIGVHTMGGHEPGIQGKPADLAAELLRQARLRKQEGT